MEQTINPKRCAGQAVAGGILLLIGELVILGKLFYLNFLPRVPLNLYLPSLVICLLYIFFAVTLMTCQRSFLQLIPVGLIAIYEIYRTIRFISTIDTFGNSMREAGLSGTEVEIYAFATVLPVLTIISMLLVVILAATNQKHTLCALPGIFAIINLILSTFAFFALLGSVSAIDLVFGQTNLFVSLGMLFAGIGIGKPATEFVWKPGENGSGKGTYGYVSMGAHIAGLFFTFGIYLLVWIYRTTAALNRDESEPPRSPGAKLALCMFIPFYYLYWTYKSAQRLDRLSEKYGQSSNMATLCLILAIFVGFVPPIIMQDKLNNIIEYENGKAAPQFNRPTNIDAADELKKYKELLDSGAITQEEYEAKKAQLLKM